MNEAKTKTSYLQLLCLVLSATFAIGLFFYLASRIFWEAATFDTDEADHANAGLVLYHAFRSGSGLEVLSAIFRQSFYPPLHSFFVAASYYIFGVELWSSRIPSLLLVYAAIFFILKTTVKLLDDLQLRDVTLSGLSLVIIFFINCSVLIYNSVLCMLEPAAVFAVSFFLYILSRRNLDKHNLFWLTFIMCLVCFSKYTTTICFSLALVSYLLLDQNITRVFKIKLLTVLVVIAGVWLAVADLEAIRAFVFEQPKTNLTLFSSKNLLFYPISFSKHYVTNPLIFYCIMIPGLVVGSIYCLHHRLIKFCLYLFLWTSIILFISTENGARHFLFAFPAIVVLVVSGWCFILSRMSVYAMQIATLAVVCIQLATVAIWTLSLPSILTRRFEAPEAAPDIFQFILKDIKPSDKLLVEGLGDALSIEGLRWYAAKQWNRSTTAVVIDYYPYRKDMDLRSKWQARNISSWPIDRGYNLVDGLPYYTAFVRIYNPAVNIRMKKLSESDRERQVSYLANYNKQTFAQGKHRVDKWMKSRTD